MSETRQTYPDKAQQGCTRQSLLPILGAQSLKAVLMSGTDRQFCRTQDKQCNHYYSMWKWSSTAPPTDHWEMTEGCAYTGWIEFLRSLSCVFSHRWSGVHTSTSCLLASTRRGTPSRTSLLIIFSVWWEQSRFTLDTDSGLINVPPDHLTRPATIHFILFCSY